MEEPDGEWGEKVLELAKAMDEWFPLPERDLEKPFLVPVEDIFSIEGRGTVVTGRVERGKVKVGEEVEIVGMKDTTTTTVTGVEMFNKQLDAAQAGDNAGILLRGTKKDDVHRGQVWLLKVRLHHTLNLKLRFTFSPKTRVADTRHSSPATTSKHTCLLYTSPSPRDRTRSRMPSSA